MIMKIDDTKLLNVLLICYCVLYLINLVYKILFEKNSDIKTLDDVVKS